MEDRELLEMAAKAAGYEVREVKGFGLAMGLEPGPPIVIWNPMAEDGDALRLAVNLGIRIAPESKAGNVASASATGDFIGHLCIEVHGNDRYSATRRAIVRCAAEIGKAML